MNTDNEIFDVVDLHDRVVGRELRKVVHAQGLLHRAVHIFVQNPKGEMYLQKRSMSKDRWPGVWTTGCSGHVDQGESYVEAAVRELQEELGIVCSSTDLGAGFKQSPNEETEQEFIQVFTLVWQGDVQPNADEISAGRWVSARALDQWIADRPDDFAPSFKCIWRRMRGVILSSPSNLNLRVYFDSHEV